MALSSALNAATAGLFATSRRAEVASFNIANAVTSGYARRELSVQSNAFGPGPQVLGVIRRSDAALVGDRRTAQATAEGADLLSSRLLRIEQAIGTIGEGGGLTDAINAFDAALIRAAASPEQAASLSAVVEAARVLTSRFRETSEVIQQTRADADKQIATEVDTLNKSLRLIADLDDRIVAARAANRDAASLQDQRQQLIDGVARIIPLREVPRPDGRPALIALNGAILLDGRPAEFDFTAATAVTASSGAPLSGLALNGRPLATGRDSLIAGGTLTAAFALRDQITVGFQAGLDDLAQDLALRLQSADDTLATGQPGLLTDQGSAPEPASLAGLSARLALNSLVDPNQGGTLSLVRDGLSSVDPGSPSDGGRLLALQQALVAASPQGIADRATNLVQSIAATRLSAEADTARAQAKAALYQEAEAATGVSTDQELQNLLLIEKAYAANAKVLQVVDGLLQTLLEV
jgi:flagellar hook-associated protein 1